MTSLKLAANMQIYLLSIPFTFIRRKKTIKIVYLAVKGILTHVKITHLRTA